MRSIKSIAFITIVTLVACSGSQNSQPRSHNSNITQSAEHSEIQDTTVERDSPIVKKPEEIMKGLLEAMKNKDVTAFTSALPTQGIIISIDNYIDTSQGDHRITPDFDVEKPLFWGIAPSGDSIIMTFREVFDTYLAHDFSSAIKTEGVKCVSTVKFNAEELWENVVVYEYCINPPSKENQTLNWKAVRFVLSGDSLVAIVLDRWSP